MSNIEHIAGAYVPGVIWWDIENSWSANSYLVRDGDALYIVDSGVGSLARENLTKAIGSHQDMARAFLINTHGHFDHSGNGAIFGELKERFPQAYYYTHEAAKRELYYFVRFVPNLGKQMEAGLKHSQWLLEAEAQDLRFGDISFQGWKAGESYVLSTPGHTDDSVSLFNPANRALFTGDLLWYVNPNTPRGSLKQVLESVANLERLAGAVGINYLGEGHSAPILGEAEVVKHLSAYQEKLETLASNLEKIVKGRERVSIDYCLSKLRESRVPAVAEAFRVNFPHLPSYLDIFAGVFLREEGWHRIDKAEGGIWVASGDDLGYERGK